MYVYANEYPPVLSAVCKSTGSFGGVVHLEEFEVVAADIVRRDLGDDERPVRGRAGLRLFGLGRSRALQRDGQDAAGRTLRLLAEDGQAFGPPGVSGSAGRRK